MTKYLTQRFSAAEGAARWQRTVDIAQKYWEETASGLTGFVFAEER